MNEEDVAAKLHQLRSRIAEAATDSGRPPADVRLLLATKTVPAERITQALRAGLTLIGENRVQEMIGKADALQSIPHTMHLIGHLQRNKVAAALPLIDCLQTLDSTDLAERIDRRLGEASSDQQPAGRHPGSGSNLDVMIQVNVSGEHTKAGVRPERTAELVDTVHRLSALRLVGLMTIGLNSTDLHAVRRGYAQLRELRDRLVPGGHLSMGMSGDFEAAIAEGATIVRIGSAAFGSRP
jgi:pyridoxal phosphate enzyme (YggS family)